MTYDLTKFDLGDMLKCSLRLRETASGAPTLEVSRSASVAFYSTNWSAPTLSAPALWSVATRRTLTHRSIRISRALRGMRLVA